MGHSWHKWPGEGWKRITSGYAGYYNHMIRVVVEDDTAVAPTSVGRIKALYY